MGTLGIRYDESPMDVPDFRYNDILRGLSTETAPGMEIRYNGDVDGDVTEEVVGMHIRERVLRLQTRSKSH